MHVPNQSAPVIIVSLSREWSPELPNACLNADKRSSCSISWSTSSKFCFSEQKNNLFSCSFSEQENKPLRRTCVFTGQV